MKIFWAKYEHHNENTESWNNFFEHNDNVQKYLTKDINDADMIVCSGGDGTLLKTVKKYIEYKKPIYGINAGTLGFLMNDISSFDFIVDVLENKGFKSKKLSTISVKVNKKEFYAFNEIALGGNMSSWIEFDINNKVLPKTFMGGGIIFSTAQGSTGINKNNGGVVVPISSNQWCVTGDKTNINLNTVIKPRKTKISVESRKPVTVWIDGTNNIIENVNEVLLNKGPKVSILFSDYEGFVEKRYK